MLTDGEADSQDSGKMQQEVSRLDKILVSKLEKHSAPKWSVQTHTRAHTLTYLTHTDSKETASLEKCKWGRSEWHGDQAPDGALKWEVKSPPQGHSRQAILH